MEIFEDCINSTDNCSTSSVVEENENNDEIYKELDNYTKNFLQNIKNNNFRKNIFDVEKKLVVSSVYFKKKTKLGKDMSTMVWQFYRHRGKLDVNTVINKYGRDNLIINYSLSSNKN